MELYKKQKIKVTLEEYNGIAFIKEVWQGIITSEELRMYIKDTLEIYEKQLPKLKQETVFFLLYADISEMELIKKDDMLWLDEYATPRYLACGITHQALIMPKSFFAQQSLKSYEGKTEDGKFTTNLFATEREALDWFFNE